MGQRLLYAIFFVVLSLSSREALTSSVVENKVTLPDLVKRSEIILIAKPVPHEYLHFTIIEVLKNSVLKIKNGAEVEVLPANYDLWQQIDQARKNNQPVPTPILEGYATTLAADQIQKAHDPILIFLKFRKDSRLEFVIENAFESISKKKDVTDLIP